MLYQIKSRYEGKILFELEIGSLKLCVDAAVKSNAHLCDADLRGADLRGSHLSGADLRGSHLRGANLCGSDLRGSDLRDADLSGSDLRDADLSDADLCGANLRGSDLSGADLKETKNMVKTMGVEAGNYYWKRFKEGLCNNGYQFKIGLNKLRKGEVFADDERQTCSYPAFHFASKSWCAVNYSTRPLEALIRIPKGAKINEPWTTDGKASADRIEIVKVFDAKTGKNVTRKHK
jgi:hypothetical protein